MYLAPLQIEITDAMFIEEATKRFAAQREYNVSTYDCNNYSADFQNVMGEFGFDLVTVHGYPENGTGHAWNAISFEPQGTGFKDFRDKYPFDRVLKQD